MEYGEKGYLCPAFTEAHCRMWRTAFLQSCPKKIPVNPPKPRAALDVRDVVGNAGLDSLVGDAATKVKYNELEVRVSCSKAILLDAKCERVRDSKKGYPTMEFFIKAKADPRNTRAFLWYADHNNTAFDDDRACYQLAVDLINQELQTRANQARVVGPELVEDFFKDMDLPKKLPGLDKYLDSLRREKGSALDVATTVGQLIQSKADREITAGSTDMLNSKIPRNLLVYQAILKGRVPEFNLRAGKTMQKDLKLPLSKSDGDWIPISTLEYQGVNRANGRHMFTLHYLDRGSYPSETDYSVSRRFESRGIRNIVEFQSQMAYQFFSVWGSDLAIPDEVVHQTAASR